MPEKPKKKRNLEQGEINDYDRKMGRTGFIGAVGAQSKKIDNSDRNKIGCNQECSWANNKNDYTKKQTILT